MLQLSELERLQLENTGLKLGLIQDQINRLSQEADKLQVEKREIFKSFAEANGLDIETMSINIPTGMVSLMEDKKEV